MHIIAILLLLGFSISQGWQIGKNHVYEYRFKNTLISNSNDRYFGTGTFQFKWIEPELLIGRLIPEEWNYGRGVGSPLPDKEKQFQVSFKNGLITELKVTPSTSKWQTEYIRGIVGLLQVSKLYLEKNRFSIMEESVAGMCETQYSVRKETSIYTITKAKDYTNCEKIPIYQRGVYGSNHDALIKKRDIIARNTTSVISLSKIHGLISSATKEIIQLISEKSTAEFISESVLIGESSPLELSEENDFDVKNLTPVGGLMYRPEIIQCNKNVTFHGKKILSYCETDHYMDPKNYDFSYEGSEVKIAKKLVEQIAKEMETLVNLPETNSLDRFSILVKIVRELNLKQLKEVSKLWKDDARRLVFQNAIIQAGTLDALKMIKFLEDNNELTHGRLMVVKLAEKAHPLSLEYLDTLFEFASDSKLMKKNFEFSKNLYLTFNNLLRRYVIERVKPFEQKELDILISKKYRPYLSGKLEETRDDDDLNFQIYARALGNMADVQLFDEYLALDSDELTPFQKLVLVNSVDRTVELYPEQCRSALFKLYESREESTSVRIASVYHLLKTNLPEDFVLEIIKIAKETNDKNIQNAVLTSVLSKFYNYHANKKISKLADTIDLQLDLDEEIRPTQLASHMFGDMSDDIIKSFLTFERIRGRSDDPMSAIKTKMFDKNGFKSSLKVSIIISEVAAFFEDLLQIPSLAKDSQGGSANFEMGTDFSQLFIPLSKLKFSVSDFLKLLDKIRNLKESFLYLEEVSIGFPTESGFPFLYLYQSPELIALESALNLNDLNLKIRVLRSNLERIEMGFVNPLTGEYYVQGVNIDRHMDVPLSLTFASGESGYAFTVDPLFRTMNQRIIHLSSLPYNGIRDIFSFKPVAEDDTMTFLKSDSPSERNFFLFDEKDRFTFKIITSDGKLPDWKSIVKKIKPYIGAYNYSGPFGDVEAIHNKMSLFFNENANEPTSLIFKLQKMTPVSESERKLKAEIILKGSITVSIPLELSLNTIEGYDLATAAASFLFNNVKVYETCLEVIVQSEDNFKIFVKMRMGKTCEEGGFVSLDVNVGYEDLGKGPNILVLVKADFEGVSDVTARWICGPGMDKMILEYFIVKVVLERPEKCKNFMAKAEAGAEAKPNDILNVTIYEEEEILMEM